MVRNSSSLGGRCRENNDEQAFSDLQVRFTPGDNQQQQQPPPPQAEGGNGATAVVVEKTSDEAGDGGGGSTSESQVKISNL